MEFYCTYDSWVEKNKTSLSWYRETYPFLQKGTFPVPLITLRNFYTSDISERNLDPVPGVLNCYEALFSYYLENVPKVDDPSRFYAQNWFDRLLSSIPKGFEKTFSDVGNFGGDFLESTKYIFFILLIVVVMFFWSKIK